MRVARTMLQSLTLLASVACTATLPPVVAPAPGAPATPSVAASGRDWPSYNGTHEGTRYSSLSQLTAANAATL